MYIYTTLMYSELPQSFVRAHIQSGRGDMKNLSQNKDVVDLTHVLLLSVYPRLEIISFSYRSKSQLDSSKPYVTFVFEYDMVSES